MARGAYAKGKWALGECARSGRKMLLRNMIADGYYPNLIVDPGWYEPKHPQEAMPSLKDPTALFRPAPDRDLVGGVINLGGALGLDAVPGGGFGDTIGLGGSGGAGGSSISSGYELSNPVVSFASGSFFVAPIIFYDQVLACTGTFAVFNEIRFNFGGSKIQTINADATALIDVTTMPLQFHTSNPGPLPAPPDAGDNWYLRYINPEGPDTFDFEEAPEDVWKILNTSRFWRISRPDPGNTNEVTVTFEISSRTSPAPEDEVAIYAQGRVTLRYTNP